MSCIPSTNSVIQGCPSVTIQTPINAHPTLTFPSPLDLDCMFARRNDNNPSTEPTSPARPQAISAVIRLVQNEVARQPAQLIIDVNGHLHVHCIYVNNAQFVRLLDVERVFNGKGITIWPRHNSIDVPLLEDHSWRETVNPFNFDVARFGWGASGCSSGLAEEWRVDGWYGWQVEGWCGWQVEGWHGWQVEGWHGWQR
jgi:hypothetical protein